MKRIVISFSILLLNTITIMAGTHGDHGKIYSVNGGHGSSGGLILVVIILIGIVCYVAIASHFNNKK